MVGRASGNPSLFKCWGYLIGDAVRLFYDLTTCRAFLAPAVWRLGVGNFGRPALEKLGGSLVGSLAQKLFGKCVLSHLLTLLSTRGMDPTSKECFTFCTGGALMPSWHGANLGNSWLPPIQPIESGIWLEAKGKSLTSSLPRLSFQGESTFRPFWF